MKKLRKIWLNLLHLGIQRGTTDDSHKRNLLLCNFLCITLFSFALFRVIVETIVQSNSHLYIPSVIFVLTVPAVLVMNKFNYSISSRLFFVVDTLIILHIPLLSGNFSQIQDYFSFGYLHLMLISLPMLLFDVKNERKYVMILLVFQFFLFFTSDFYFIKFSRNQELINFLKPIILIHKITATSIWLMIVGAFYFLRNINIYFENKLLDANHELQVKNEEIATQNEEIIAQNEEIMSQNEEMSVQSETLNQHNVHLSEAQKIIQEQNHLLVAYNETLENKVAERTEEILDINRELVQQNHQLEQFAFVVAHNIRAPVARVLGLVSLLEIENLINEQNEFLINKISFTTHELDHIIHDLNHILDIKKGFNEIMQEVSISKSCHNVLKLLENQIEETGIEIRTNFSSIDLIVSVKVYIESILYNLISNSIKYRLAGSKSYVDISSSVQGDQMVLTVSDNGIGMDMEKVKEHLYRLYKRFHTHVEGKGLGLHLVKTQVDALSGKIEVESAVWQGTTFRIFLKRDIDESKNIIVTKKEFSQKDSREHSSGFKIPQRPN